MGQIGIWQIVIVAIVVLVLFGKGRISEMMGDFGKGVSSFKKGLNDEDKPAGDSSARIGGPDAPPSATTESKPAEPADKNA